MNTFGTKFRITLFGTSHGPVVGVAMEGVKPGVELSADDFTGDLERRQGGGPGATPRREADVPEILSGVFDGRTTGAPLTIVFRNDNTTSSDYDTFRRQPRPSHADLTAAIKYGGSNDPRGGGQFSGRMTVGLVAAGVVAKKMLGGVAAEARIAEIGGCGDPQQFAGITEAARLAGDSVGGIVECRVTGIPAGWGEPFFDSVESMISHIVFSIPGVRGIEFGTGFAAAAMCGSEHNDPIIDRSGTTSTNHAGGVNGGITNGNPLMLRVALKPTASISAEQSTFDFEAGKVMPLSISGRHDACIALRAAVVVEAAVAVALAQFC